MIIRIETTKVNSHEEGLEWGKILMGRIFGLVKGVFLNDEVAGYTEQGRLKVDAARVDPLARLGASEYVSFGRVIERKRPR